MEFNVAQLLKERVGSRRTYSLAETFYASKDTGTTRAEGKITLTRTDKGVWVSGRIEANASSSCSRCLAFCDYLVRFNIDEEYFPTVDMVTGQSVEVSDVAGGAFTIDSHHTLELTEAVRQYVIANLPMKPLCQGKCVGLCPTCGANLNEGECQCSVPVVSRWTPLLGILSGVEKG